MSDTDRPTRVAVVVDVEGVRRTAASTARLDDRALPDPDGIAEVLGSLGWEVTEVRLVVGDIHVPGPFGTMAARVGRRISAEVHDAPAAAVTPAQVHEAMLTSFDADGRYIGELGVDGLLVAACLSLARDITSGHSAAQAVVLICPDEDAWIVHRYPLGVPVLYAGDLTPTQRDQIVAQNGRWLALDAEQLAAMLAEPVGDQPARATLASHADPIAPLDAAERAGQQRAAARLEPMRSAATIAVVDAYDIFRHGLAAVGAARLPGPEQVRGLMARLRLPQPSAVYATFPDLHDELLAAAGDHASGWVQRDTQFAASVADYEHDDDPATVAQVGELLLEPTPGGRLAIAGQRRISTAVVADAWWAMHANPDAEVVVLSDRWDTVALQLHAGELGLPEPSRLVRIGTQPLNLAGSRLGLIVLTDELLAELLQVPVPTGRLQRIAGAALATGPRGPRRWRVVDVAPERHAVVLVAADDPTVVAHADTGILGEQDMEPAAVIELERFAVRIDGRGAVIPRLVEATDHDDGILHARVIGRIEPTTVMLDLDADNVADMMVDTPGDLAPLPVGTEIVLSTDKDGSLWYVGPADDQSSTSMPEPRVEVIQIVDASPGALRGQREQGGDVAVRPLRGNALVSGDLVLACPFGETEWIGFSSQLRHLRAADQ